MAAAHRRSVAGPARLLRSLADGRQPLYRWRRQGVFDRLLAEVTHRADVLGELDWLVHYVDGSVVRAHQHVAGARRQPSVADRTGEAHRRRMRPWGAVAAG